MPNSARILGKSGGSRAILVAADGRIAQDLVGTSSGSAERLEKNILLGRDGDGRVACAGIGYECIVIADPAP